MPLPNVANLGAKPESVVRGVACLWVVTALLGLQAIMLLILDSSTLPGGYSRTGAALSIAYFAFVAVKISAGRNWARMLFGVCFALNVAILFATTLFLTGLYAGTPISSLAVSIIAFVVQAAAAVFLFSPSSNRWFERQRADVRQSAEAEAPVSQTAAHAATAEPAEWKSYELKSLPPLSNYYEPTGLPPIVDKILRGMGVLVSGVIALLALFLGIMSTDSGTAESKLIGLTILGIGWLIAASVFVACIAPQIVQRIIPGSKAVRRVTVQAYSYLFAVGPLVLWLLLKVGILGGPHASSMDKLQAGSQNSLQAMPSMSKLGPSDASFVPIARLPVVPPLNLFGEIDSALTVDITVAYQTTERKCERQVKYGLEGYTGPKTYRLKVDVKQSGKQYKADIPINKFEPGDCGWRPFAIEYAVKDSKGVPHHMPIPPTPLVWFTKDGRDEMPPFDVECAQATAEMIARHTDTAGLLCGQKLGTYFLTQRAKDLNVNFRERMWFKAPFHIRADGT